MADYIDRQAAVDAIESHIRVGDELYPLSITDLIKNYGFEVAASCVYNLPPADAVEVVRCRDCKHRYIDGENVRYNVCDLNHNKVQEDDWYCADGERKDD